MGLGGIRSLVLASWATATVLAHKHHNEEADGAENIAKPIDAILYFHIAIQIVAWGFVFPVGMVFGMVRSRWHVPTQVAGYVLTSVGYILGHAHGGRAFKETVHGPFASFLFLPMTAQFILGVYLKLHIHERTVRPYFVIVHGLLGKIWPILGWTQMISGAATLGGYCFGDGLNQCLSHYIMGSSFIAYGILLAIVLLVGSEWIRSTGRSQEWFDSFVIVLWGIVNTFTEHHGPLRKWSHKDLQHMSLGIIWWAGGGLGLYLSRNGQRSTIPGIVIVITGWAMSAHKKAMSISTEVHTIFGVVLMSAGIARVIEVSLVLRDQHLPPLLLVTAGVLFMSATEEELKFAKSMEVDHVTYALLMSSLGFIIYLHAVFLINLWRTSGRNAITQDGTPAAPRVGRRTGYTRLRTSTNGILHDEEIFELGPADYEPDDPLVDRRGDDWPNLSSV